MAQDAETKLSKIHPAHARTGSVSRRILDASNGEFSESFPAGGRGSPREAVLTYRQFFAARWSRFIRANFDSPEQAADAFGVDGSTAKNWWDGSHAPSGFAVGYAYQNFAPEALQPLQRSA